MMLKCARAACNFCFFFCILLWPTKPLYVVQYVGKRLKHRTIPPNAFLCYNSTIQFLIVSFFFFLAQQSHFFTCHLQNGSLPLLSKTVPATEVIMQDVDEQYLLWWMFFFSASCICHLSRKIATVLSTWKRGSWQWPLRRKSCTSVLLISYYVL